MTFFQAHVSKLKVDKKNNFLYFWKVTYVLIPIQFQAIVETISTLSEHSSLSLNEN